MAACFSGMLGRVVEQPFDTIKTLVQTDRAHQFRGPFDCFRKTWYHSGMEGLYRGTMPPMYGAIGENVALFVTYRGICSHFQNGNKDRQMKLSEIAIAGTCAGIAASFVLTPAELIKCRLQNDLKKSLTGQRMTYRGSMDCMAQVFRKEGLRGFFAGHVPTMYREAAGSGAQFVVYESLCRYFLSEGQTKKDLSSAKLMASGGIGGMFYWLVLYPADVVKTHAQTVSSEARGSNVGILKMIFKRDGMRGLYRGLGTTLVRAIPANAVIFYSYEASIQFLERIDNYV